jgi:phosphoribosylaminoimidazole-succinocarboxamide synthase
MQNKIVQNTELENLKLVNRGKVRDIYDLGDKLLMVSTDRISAFDVILPDGIPAKGRVLTGMSKFWFDHFSNIIKHHLVSTDVAEFPSECKDHANILKGRSMIVKKTRPLPVECIVRGYLSGSGWKDYCRTGSVCGIALPKGLKESDRLEKPLFTPSTKAEVGTHDENVSFKHICSTIGRKTAEKIRDLSLKIYENARAFAEQKGIIIADTKMEFGILDEEIILIDELLTPDSSRFWPKDSYEPGRSQMSFDKQFVRDYLNSLDWDHTPPAPDLPSEIISKTTLRYLEAYSRITGTDLIQH